MLRKIATYLVVGLVATASILFIQATKHNTPPVLSLLGARTVLHRGTTTVAVYKHAPLDHQAISAAIVEASRLGYTYESGISTCHPDSNACMTSLIFVR